MPEDVKNKWDRNFVKVDDETLFNLMLAANYLDIKPLLDLTCKTVADEIKGKPPEDIRARFNIKPEFVLEELPTAKLIEWIEEFGTTPTCEIAHGSRASARRSSRRRCAAEERLVVEQQEGAEDADQGAHERRVRVATARRQGKPYGASTFLASGPPTRPC